MNQKRQNIILILLALYLGQALGLHAQISPAPCDLSKADSLDKLLYRVVYELSYLQDPEKKEFVTQDLVRLDIGLNLSKEYSYRYYRADSASQGQLADGGIPRMVMDVLPPWILYKHYERPEGLLMDYRLPVKAPVMEITDSLPKLSWQLTGEKSGLLGYPVEEAKCAFGGRQWTAWFTPEIPISEGPYKFGGLPGLILDLKDSEGDYHYSCVSFAEPAIQEAIVYWQLNQQKTDRKTLQQIIRRLHANPDAALKALGAGIKFAGDPMIDEPYNPIEKDWK